MSNPPCKFGVDPHISPIFSVVTQKVTIVSDIIYLVFIYYRNILSVLQLF